MTALLVLTIGITILLIVFTLKLLFKIRVLTKKIKYVDEANMWHKLAVTDDLTGVYNRNAYNLYVDKIEKNNKPKPRWIILFDVDDFKIINDTKGHLEGDILLKNVAMILSEVFSAHNYRIFRMGGDEFSVLAEDVSEDEVVERLITLKRHLEHSGNISLSKGYSAITNDSEKAFKYADEMLYADKLSKKMRNCSVEGN